jgi:GT2 family glycosyltransferase/trans-aconitate methyltransferase
MANNETKVSAQFDYSKYPHLHIEDSKGKIEELSKVIPSDFRVRTILNVGSDADLITQAIGKRYGASQIDTLDLSDQVIELSRITLTNFSKSEVKQCTLEEYKPTRSYDLIMFINVLEHLNDPINTLKTAAKLSKFLAVRSPLEESFINRLEKKYFGKDYQKVMEQRYGHIQHFSQESFKEILNTGGFDVINTEYFRVSNKADILKGPTHKFFEKTVSFFAKDKYPKIWGGFCVAFCKSRETKVIDPESEKKLITLLEDEFGKENLISLGLFGSIIDKNHKQCSDYDFTVILKEASSNVDERESASPRLKRKLRDLGLKELCAFNIYTQQEFENADKQNSWLIETMRNDYRVILDKNDYLLSKLSNKKDSIEKINMFAWKGIKTEDSIRFESVAERHSRCAELLKNNYPEFSLYHKIESYRGKLMARLLKNGIYNSRDSLISIAKELKYKFNDKEINLDEVRCLNFQQEMEGKPSIYKYNNVQKHLEVADILNKNSLRLDALFHTYSALRCFYLESLHSNDTFILNGEVTQIFLREQFYNLSDDLINKIYQYSFKAEQVLGRTGYISFDLGDDGKNIFADESNTETEQLSTQLNSIINELILSKDILVKKNDKTKISLAIATFNRPGYLEKCIDSINKLIIPSDCVEIVIVDDGSSEKYNVDLLQKNCSFQIRYIKKEHSGICATKNKAIEESSGEFMASLDDDMVVSPLWLIQLMSGFVNENIAGVGSTVLTYPDEYYLTKYSDYRELIRRPFKDSTGEILNVLTGSACIRKTVLQEIGGFNQKQSDEGIAFGGDDVDITWAIRNQGYKLNHVEDAITFHNHRNNIKSLIKQHIGYGEGTTFHCVYRNRDPKTLGIPEAKYTAVVADLAHYLILEVPKRIKNCYKDNLGFKNSIKYPVLDFTRRLFYDVGILKARKSIKKHRQ